MTGQLVHPNSHISTFACHYPNEEASEGYSNAKQSQHLALQPQLPSCKKSGTQTGQPTSAIYCHTLPVCYKDATSNYYCQHRQY
jgi:hypothetical protein